MNRAPKPETGRALLVSDGYGDVRVTLHEFVEARPIDISGPGGGAAYEYVFKCLETGIERRWGTCDRLEGMEN